MVADSRALHDSTAKMILKQSEISVLPAILRELITAPNNIVAIGSMTLEASL